MYNPRPYTPTISAPFRPNLMTQPPGFMPQTMGFQPKFRPQMPIPHPIIPQNNNDIYLSVFIGEIPEGITDEFMEQILNIILKKKKNKKKNIIIYIYILNKKYYERRK